MKKPQIHRRKVATAHQLVVVPKARAAAFLEHYRRAWGGADPVQHELSNNGQGNATHVAFEIEVRERLPGEFPFLRPEVAAQRKKSFPQAQEAPQDVFGGKKTVDKALADAGIVLKRIPPKRQDTVELGR